MKILGVVLGVLALLAAWAAGSYNSLVGRNEAVSMAWATVESQYQRRMDLIPNLVETVKGSARFEKETLAAVTDARSRAGSVVIDRSVINDPEAFRRFEQAQAGLTSALSRLLAVAERYPDIKSTQGFRDLQVQLEGTENRIAVARKDFNDAAQSYNTSIKVLPGALVARLAGFRERPYFQAAPEADKAPAVRF